MLNTFDINVINCLFLIRGDSDMNINCFLNTRQFSYVHVFTDKQITEVNRRLALTEGRGMGRGLNESKVVFSRAGS